MVRPIAMQDEVRQNNQTEDSNEEWQSQGEASKSPNEQGI